MLISLIMAADRHGLIGDRGGLPWRLPRDLKRFRSLTWGKPIIMGRRTFDSLGRPLPGRTNIVLSRNADFQPEGIVAVASLEEAFEVAEHAPQEGASNEAFVIGGAEVFLLALPLAQRVHLTLVDGEFQGDVHFPLEVFIAPEWKLSEDESWAADENNPHSLRFLLYERQPLPSHTPTGLPRRRALNRPRAAGYSGE
ncbi:dihydrofolate reductase [Singulisphaera sp. PoT]|uniref:dihydrofolate reductase n=1 Tax=Singulisphaera sp. PoT TaxID=3411797 RepID=UPI003BF509AC